VNVENKLKLFFHNQTKYHVEKFNMFRNLEQTKLNNDNELSELSDEILEYIVGGAKNESIDESRPPSGGSHGIDLTFIPGVVIVKRDTI
jgi:hypothetical protein